MADAWIAGAWTSGAWVEDAWEAAGVSTYTVTYDGNGNTGGSAPTDGSSPYDDESVVTVLGQGTLVRSGGYLFSNWNTAADGSGHNYYPSDTFAISADTVLYAIWWLPSAVGRPGYSWKRGY